MVKQRRLGTKRFKSGFFFKFLKDMLVADLSSLSFWFPNTFRFLTGKTIFIMVDYNNIREMNMDLVGKQSIDLIQRYNRIYKKNSDFWLCRPPK